MIRKSWSENFGMERLLLESYETARAFLYLVENVFCDGRPASSPLKVRVKPTQAEDQHVRHDQRKDSKGGKLDYA